MTNDQIKSGGELAMMRQSAGMKAKDLAAALDISPEHLSRMEQGTKPVSRVMELAIRTVLSRTPSHGRVSGDLRKALEHIKMDAEEALFPHGPVMADALRKIAERAEAALSTPAENGEVLPVTIGGTEAKFAKDAAPAPVEGEILQADRDAAGDLWTEHLGWSNPDPHDGAAAEMLESIAFAFAAHRRAFSGGVDERAQIIAWLHDDAGKTRDDLKRLHAARKLTIGQTVEWEALISLKAGIADAIERGEHLSTIKEPRG